MLNYIATEKTSELIKNICAEKNLLILYEQIGITNISKYLKETKVNFNIIRYFIIDISCLDNTETEIVENIYNFTRLHEKIRIIILAQEFDNNSKLLNDLYDIGIYNIVNSNNQEEIRNDLIKCLSEKGLQKKDVKRFEKIEKIQVKPNKFKNVIDSLKTKISNIKVKSKNEQTATKKNKIIDAIDSNNNSNAIIQQSGSVYFFALFLEAITRLVRIICYIAVFVLTSIGITILLNPQLRETVFQILGLK